MNFFKSVFSDDIEEEQPSPDLDPQTQSSSSSSSHIEEEQTQLPNEPLTKNPNFTSDSPPNSVWSFGGLIKTITSKSESVLQTYKKDLQEFSSELKKETAVIRQVASRAVKDLPGSLEVGASVAQESLESVGQAIDDLGSTVWKGTTGIITHGKDVLVSFDHQESGEFSDSTSNNSNNAMSSRRYSRFDLQIRSIQVDLGTYVEEPDDLDEFDKWRSGFVLGEKDEEIDNLLSENGDMDSVYRRIVPKTIDDETFWSRYFYKVYKLKQVEEARANLVRRAISGDDEELSWDVDDEEEDEGNVLRLEGETTDTKSGEKGELLVGESSNAIDNREEKNAGGEIVEKDVVLPLKAPEDASNQEGPFEGESDISEINDKNLTEASDEIIALDGKSDQAESSKDSDVSVVSTQPSLPEEQDLSWDEIEDLSSIDRKKGSVGDSPNKADLRKRLSMADDDEDLSWDIEDDD